MNQAQCRTIVKERAVSAFGDWMLGWIDVTMPMCERCGKYAVDECHHRLNRSQGGKWKPSNIAGLCRWCHEWVTTHPADAAEDGWHVRGFANPAKVPVKMWYVDSPVYLDDEGGYGPCCEV